MNSDGPMATEDEAHREWHRNTGTVPHRSTCPWDCDPTPWEAWEDYDVTPEDEGAEPVRDDTHERWHEEEGPF